MLLNIIITYYYYYGFVKYLMLIGQSKHSEFGSVFTVSVTECPVTERIPKNKKCFKSFYYYILTHRIVCIGCTFSLVYYFTTFKRNYSVWSADTVGEHSLHTGASTHFFKRIEVLTLMS